MNPDIILHDLSAIEKLINYMENHNNISLIQPLIIDSNSSSIQHLCKRNPTFYAQFIRAFMPVWAMENLWFLRSYNNWYEMRSKAYGKVPVESQYLSGCFMLCRRKCLDNVNWFDERYFMYLEDADLTRTLSYYGKCLHYPLAEIKHVWAKGSHKKLNLKITAIKSFIKYSLKWGLEFI